MDLASILKFRKWLITMTTLQVMMELCAGKYVVNSQTEDITCWTCPNMKSNTDCNSWAPNIPCPKNHTVCQTIHRIHKRTGETILLNKMCAAPAVCDHKVIGCRNTKKSSEMECISCCNSPLCNEDIPTDLSSAIKLSVLHDSSDARVISLDLVLLVLCFLPTISRILTAGS